MSYPPLSRKLTETKGNEAVRRSLNRRETLKPAFKESWSY